jgi:hypothetical protein
VPRKRADLQDRFCSHVEIMDNGCWEWRGEIINSGYGRFHVSSKARCSAHRFSLLLLVGHDVVNEVDHLCFNKICVNPDHLEDVTRQENELRSVRRNSCIRRGHDLTNAANVLVTSRHGRERRYCRPCRQIAQNTLRRKRTLDRRGFNGRWPSWVDTALRA